jgi:hypothetical protein
MRKNVNTENIEGKVYQFKLEKKVTGENSKNPGTEFISGTLDVATTDVVTEAPAQPVPETEVPTPEPTEEEYVEEEEDEEEEGEKKPNAVVRGFKKMWGWLGDIVNDDRD